MTEARWARRARLGAAIVFLISGRAAVARAATAMTIVAPDGCPAALRERIAEQIADVAEDVGWSCQPRLDGDEPFRGEAAAGDALRFWIDLTPGTEARLMLRDGRSDRFLARRIALPHGLDEIGREEIGQIVRSALVAVRAAPDDTLTRAEARAEVARWQQPPPAPPAAPPPATVRAVPGAPRRQPVAIELGAFAALRGFAPQLPMVGEIGLGLGVGRWGPMGAWVEGAYQPVFRYEGAPLGVALRAFAGRAGLDLSAHFAGAGRARVGVGAGVTRTTFTPQAEGTAGTAAPGGSFSYPTGRVLAGFQAPIGAHLASAITLFADVVGADVHYDVRDVEGTTRRVLVLHRLQPGVVWQLSWRSR